MGLKSRWLIGVAAAALVFLGFFLIGWPKEYPKQYGVTWSSPYAWGLGLNPNDGLREVLDDLGVRRFRIPAYWTDIEREQGKYDFRILREQLDMIAERKGNVMLAVGSRLPRWPECWVPDWAMQVDPATRRVAQLTYLKKTYDTFKDHPSIMGWQVENEANFTLYVNCSGLDKKLVLEELRYIRDEEAKRKDPRPVYTTDSGELSLWVDWAGEVDGLGVSLYRAVTNPWLGVINYWFIPPWAYSRKAWLARFFVDPIFVSEFQMEPWSDHPLQNTSLDDQYRTLSIEQMRKNFTYAKRVEMPAVDFWGAEWWYWMREKQGNAEFWNEAKKFFHENR
ncbi:beta-galactosidase [Candidatus Uhrbacteria bacterium]|nr:beta-galactosidase [Candidatus Uhrbacteria bacterium]